MTIQFLGAAGEVTGSKHLITTKKGKRILLDCGMFQGKGMETDSDNRQLGFEPKNLDFIILSHAHIDHSGLIPYVYKMGFRGSVICTPATRDLCSIVLQDTAFIQELDVKWYNKKMRKLHKPVISPIYDAQTAKRCMKLFITVDYDRRFRINDDISVRFTNSGHMLGSAVVNLEIKEDGEVKRIAFTGDIGRQKSHLLCPPQPFPQCDYLITESTYGDQLHDEDMVSEEELLRVVEDTCVKNQGKLIIPSFSVGRTQDIVYVLNKLHNEQRLPHVDVYVDSPLAVNATDIFRLYTDEMNEDVQATMTFDHDPFGFNSLHYITDIRESKQLNYSGKPCIIISASGMCEAGRVKHHVANHIEDPSTTILIVGYCTPTSLGARLQEPGLKYISIFGLDHKVRAKIRKIEAFSGHGDYSEIQQFLDCQRKEEVKKVFIVHGEPHAQEAMKDHLYEIGFRNFQIPQKGDIAEL
ncbi:MAG: MBL fold metallo-hydrolase [Paludibacteraceae bacterium]|nr:MBL fold metallo-hydrolase [Paludibacteraceae bacterium]MBR1787249.1 MBL fold metallo-hydrolase [Paludibacteraceae bacterium]